MQNNRAHSHTRSMHVEFTKWESENKRKNI